MAACRNTIAGKPVWPTILVEDFARTAASSREGCWCWACSISSRWASIFALSALVDGGMLLKHDARQRPDRRSGNGGRSFSPLAVLVAMACYIPVAMLFWFAPILVAWHDVPPAKALFFSFVSCWRNRGAFVFYGALWIAIALAVSFGLTALMQALGAGRKSRSRC